MKKLIAARRCSQVFFLFLFVYILWSTTYPLKGLLPPETFFRTNPLIMIFTSISERIILPGIIFSLGMLFLTLILGRFYCGWICPLGTIIDGIGALKKKKTAPKNKTNAKIRKFKFFILGIIAAFSVFGIQVAWILDPMVIMGRFVSLNLIPTATLLMNFAFIAVIKGLDLYGTIVHDIYRTLKSSILGVKVYYFSSSGMIFLFFLIICLTAVFVSRFWCRAICPLGALYAAVAKFALLRRVVDKCTYCGTCVSACRTGAIKNDTSYAKGECILCMDCIYDCPQHMTRFTWPQRKKPKEKVDRKGEGAGGISRKEFLFMILSSLFLLGFKKRAEKGSIAGNVIRPPASLKECAFLDRCIRCGNCMKVCPTNGLQPTMLQAGLEGIWTPHLIPEIGWCEYTCTLCGNVCPTGAIDRVSLDRKLQVKLGTAKIDQSICIAWAENKDCIVCEEHCPVHIKAVRLKEERVGSRIIKKPYVVPDLCVGCGICQNKCPTRPVRAIKVSPEGADRV